MALGAKPVVKGKRVLVPVFRREIDSVDAVGDTMAGEEAEQAQPEPGRAEIRPHEQVFEEHQALQVDTWVGDGD